MKRDYNYPWVVGWWMIAVAMAMGAFLGHYFPWPGSILVPLAWNVPQAIYHTVKHYRLPR